MHIPVWRQTLFNHSRCLNIVETIAHANGVCTWAVRTAPHHTQGVRKNKGENPRQRAKGEANREAQTGLNRGGHGKATVGFPQIFHLIVEKLVEGRITFGIHIG